MSSVLADFTARVAVETEDWAAGETARVLLNEAALVLATGEDDTLSVPLSRVLDVTSGVPAVFDALPGASSTRRSGGHPSTGRTGPSTAATGRHWS